MKWKLILISAVLFLVGIPPLNLRFLSWFAFLPLYLLWLHEKTSVKQLAFSTFIVSFIYFAYGLYWLAYHLIWAYVCSVLLVVLSLPIYFLLLAWLRKKTKNLSFQIIAAAVLWVLIHQVYLLMPIGAVTAEAPFYASLAFYQILAVAGMMPLVVMVLGMNVSLAFVIKTKSRTAMIWLGVFVLALSSTYVWGSARLKTPSKADIQIAIIQHNLPVGGVWRMEHPLFIRKEYRRFALEAAKSDADLIIFPLYSFPEDIWRNPAFFTRLAKETGKYILTAAHIPKEEGQSILNTGFMNKALLYSPQGKLVGEYHAMKAPPFSEIPEYTSTQYQVIETPFGKLGVLLCYEDILPSMAKKAVDAGAEILVALSNPGSFVTTHQPYYHFLQDQFRAIESNRWLIRASANGYSGTIDPRGRITAQTQLNEERILYTRVGK